MIDPGQAHQRHLLMVGDVGSAPLDGPRASAHFPDAAALRAAVMASKVHDDTMRFDDKFLSCMPVARMKSTPPLSRGVCCFYNNAMRYRTLHATIASGRVRLATD